MSIPEVLLEVTSKTGNCTGLIAELERTLSELAPGARVCAVMKDIPTRVDVMAWANRKGHAVVADHREGPVSRMIIEKGRLPAPSTSAADR
jgi:TusA-related sulfurtransferase